MRTFSWSSIPNIIVRGTKRTVVARVTVDGRQIWRSTKIQADPAGRNADLVRDWMRAFQSSLVRDRDKVLALTRSRSTCSTFAELFSAYRVACAGRSIAARSVERNILDLRLIVRTVHGEKFSVDAARVELCTLDLLIDFRAKRLAEFKAAAAALDREAYERRLHSCQVSIKSTIQHARSIFAAEVLQERAYRQLNLPNLAEFMRFRSGGGTTREYVPPSAVVLERLRDGAELFRASRPDLWLAMVLTANCGMRRGSARNARSSWFRPSADGGAVVHVLVAKGNRSSVGVSPSAWSRIRELLGAPAREYVLPGATEQERDALLDELLVWLRGIGYDAARCPVHELRGLFVNKMKEQHSLDDAQAATGHSTQRVMIASYVARGTSKAVDVI